MWVSVIFISLISSYSPRYFKPNMSSRKNQGPRGSSRNRSRSARKIDKRISATESEFQALSLSSQPPSPSIPIQPAPKGTPANFADFGADPSGVAGEGEEDWSSLTMTAAVDPRASQLAFPTQLPYRNPDTLYGHYSSRNEQFPAENLRCVK